MDDSKKSLFRRSLTEEERERLPEEIARRPRWDLVSDVGAPFGCALILSTLSLLLVCVCPPGCVGIMVGAWLLLALGLSMKLRRVHEEQVRNARANSTKLQAILDRGWVESYDGPILEAYVVLTDEEVPIGLYFRLDGLTATWHGGTFMASALWTDELRERVRFDIDYPMASKEEPVFYGGRRMPEGAVVGFISSAHSVADEKGWTETWSVVEADFDLLRRRAIPLPAALREAAETAATEDAPDAGRS